MHVKLVTIIVALLALTLSMSLVESRNFNRKLTETIDKIAQGTNSIFLGVGKDRIKLKNRKREEEDNTRQKREVGPEEHIWRPYKNDGT